MTVKSKFSRFLMRSISCGVTNQLGNKILYRIKLKNLTWPYRDWESFRDERVPSGILIQVLHGSYRDWETDRKSTRLNSSHLKLSRMPSSA